MISVYVTFPDKKTAKEISTTLLEKKLIACATMMEGESLYHWEGKLQNDTEVVAFLKTKKENWEKVKLAIEGSHPYDVPCIVRLEVEANSAYKNWVEGETQ